MSIAAVPLLRAGILGAACLASPIPLLAQDFMFQAPRGSLSFRIGGNAPRGGGDVFDFTTEHLTLETGDLRSVAFAGELSVRLSDRFEAVAGLAAAHASAPSEFADYVEENDEPIRQTTKLQQVPITLGLRAYLNEPGQSIGRFAWIPARVAPYASVHAGATRYTYSQEGDFVDFTDLVIYESTYRSSGWAPTLQVGAGTDVRLRGAAALRFDARYQWASTDPVDEPGEDFGDFDQIDLSGLQATAGIVLRF